jgi:fumarate reductase subunit C
MVEFIKGAIQPILILIGLVALAAGIFGNNTHRRVNFIVAAIFLFLGLYGLYDEYYAVVDFFNGLIPPLLIVLGLVSVVHGIRKLT